MPRHRDALPDSGRKRSQRRITCTVFCGGSEDRRNGGAVSIWPPRRMVGPSSVCALPSERNGGGMTSGLRRSLTGSEAGTSFTESDTCSLRSHYTGITGMGGTYLAPSVTSSMWAEAASALDQRDDNASLDNASVTESMDGYVAAAVASHAGWGHAGHLALGAAMQASTLPSSAASLAAGEGRAAAAAALPGNSTREAAEPNGLEWVEQDGEMVLEVSPLPGRLLIFLSGAVDHAHRAVDPAAELVSVTAWYQ